jgi:threonyl-tRNA synthetase
MALLIEHYNGKWPFWLNPRQAIVITVNSTEPVVDWARQTQNLLLGVSPSSSTTEATSPTGLAVDFDDSDRSVGLKVREATTKGYGLIIAVGPRDVENMTVGVNATSLAKPGDSAEELKKLKRMDMAPEKLREFMLSLANGYQ